MKVIEIILLICFFSSLCGLEELDKSLKAAENSFHEGIIAKTFLGRQKSFNKALDFYKEAEKNGNSWKLDFTIGNSFFQLGEYPWAILYYQRALETNARNHDIQANLRLAYEKLGVTSPALSSTLKKTLSLDGLFNFSQRLGLFFAFSLSTLLLGSLYFWFQFSWVKGLLLFTATLSFVLLVNLMVSQYGLPVEAVVVETSLLYKDVEGRYPLLLEAPIWAGTTLQIVDVEDKGRWLKVRTIDDHLGYLFFRHVRLI